MIEGVEKGRSLWDDAGDRMRANRAAMLSLGLLILVALLSLLGPLLSPHRYDQIYQDYVRAPARLAAYPSPEQLAPGLARALRRADVEIGATEFGVDEVAVEVKAGAAIDPRIIRYVERSDLFKDAKITGQSADGRNLRIAAKIDRKHFYFGTDANGRDILTRTLVAGRISLAIGLLATLVAIFIGVFYGAAAGYAGGRVDQWMMRAVDILYALPFIFFVILLVVFFGRNFVLMFLAVGAVEWLDMARIVRGQTLSLKRQEFVQAAEALGVTSFAILRRHIVPNALGPVVIYMTLMVPKVILLESFLSFLGLGVQEPLTSWGVLISEGARNMQDGWWMLAFPSLFLTSTLFALNFIGDGLRDALDPKDR